MAKFNHILIPLDFSPASILALKCGMEIAKIHQSRVHVLHVFRLIDDQETIENSRALALRNSLTNDLKEKMEVLKTTYSDPLAIDASFELQIGFPEDVIEPYIFKHDIDTVILGTSGAGLSAECYGSTFSAIVKNNKTAIIALPKNADYETVKPELLEKIMEPNHSSQATDSSLILTISHSDFELRTKENSDQIYIIETKK